MARRYVSNATPQTPEEMAEALYEGRAGVTPEVQREFFDAYTAKMMADGSLAAQIRQQAQVVLGEYLRGSGGGGRGPGAALADAARSRNVLYNAKAPGAKAEGIFGDAADLFASVSWRSRHDAGAQGKLSKLASIQNSFGSEVPDAGGFLVPEHLRSEILAIALESSIVRPHALVIPMDTLRVPIPMIDDSSHASNVLGGIDFYWTEEGSAITESQASFGRVVLDAKKLAGYFAVPNELLGDAPAFSSFFSAVVPQALGWFEDLAFLNGTGVGEPEGLISCAGSVSVSAQPGQSTKTILWENIVGMWSRLLPQCERNAVWIANKDTFPELATMALSVGTGGGPVWIGSGYGQGGTGSSGADMPPATILGRPVYFTEKVPTLGTTGDIILADLSFYLLGDRQQMELSSSEHYAFAQDKTSFRLLERADGRPWLQQALVPHSNSSNTLSAYVQLASR
jgi:HK97 family phage major capsid protein